METSLFLLLNIGKKSCMWYNKHVIIYERRKSTMEEKLNDLEAEALAEVSKELCVDEIRF